MSRTYRIADVATRSGFTPTTLRYYEDIGLMRPAGRSDAGYRLYDDASLERLRFIARAKQLGCTLDEITDLASAWDGGECGPVQQRLLAAVEAKTAEAHARIAELTTFTAELQLAAASLRTHRPEGPCDDTCGCVSDPAQAPTVTPVPLIAASDAAYGRGGSAAARSAARSDVPSNIPSKIPSDVASAAPSDAPPIACTLDAAGMSTRLDEWHALLAERRDRLAGVTGRTSLGDGVRLELGPNTDIAEVARLAAAEQGCCRFFSFALVIDERGTALEVHAPPDAADVVVALFGAAA